MATLLERLEAAVADLALCASDNEVAEILRAEEIKGVPRGCRRCPIAVLLSKRLGSEVRVTYWSISVASSADGPEAFVKIGIPDAVRDFVENFDAGNDHLQDLAVVTS